MSAVTNFVQAGEKVEVKFKDSKAIFLVEAYTEDEFVLCGPRTKFNGLEKFPSKKMVFAKSIVVNGKSVIAGEKVVITNNKKESIDGYVCYMLNRDSLILTKKKKPSFSALRWLLKMMAAE